MSARPPSLRTSLTLFTTAASPVDQTTPPAPAAALFGAPLDRTESFRAGTAGGPAAIRELSDSLETYSPRLDRDLTDVSVVDLGDLSFDGCSLEAALGAIADASAAAASAAPLAVMLGGEHTVTLGGYRGVKRVYPDALLVHVDAHADLREQYEGDALTHASWLYHAGAEFGFDAVVQLGVRSGAREEWPSRRRLRWSAEPLELLPSVVDDLRAFPLYVTVDVDVLDPAVAPGVGCPEPGGASFADLAAFLYSLADLRVVALDVVEVAPNLDSAAITAVAAAKLVREAILLFATDRAAP